MVKLNAWKQGLGGTLLAAALALGAVPSAHALATLSVSAPATTLVGSPLTVNVLISGITDLFGYQFSLAYNPAVLRATNVAEGAFLATAGTTYFIGGTIDNTAGSVSAVADALIGPVPGAGGSGTLVTLSFDVTGPGTSTLVFSDVQLLSSSAADIPFTISNGTVTATSAVPEPAALALAGAGAAGLLMWRRRTAGSASA